LVRRAGKPAKPAGRNACPTEQRSMESPLFLMDQLTSHELPREFNKTGDGGLLPSLPGLVKFPGRFMGRFSGPGAWRGICLPGSASASFRLPPNLQTILPIALNPRSPPPCHREPRLAVDADMNRLVPRARSPSPRPTPAPPSWPGTGIYRPDDEDLPPGSRQFTPRVKVSDPGGKHA